ncbi:hypothetical protein GGR21_001862 [Dysgonomonas hofstadii]|uniref:Uncharacterized protein n=1 Tax=Dysgonomonas hofstadii TaxID=637886 RepID=A0A840CIU5_9BACT|nr:hypothetical protein [Dysgonomonas hofstadii]
MNKNLTHLTILAVSYFTKKLQKLHFCNIFLAKMLSIINILLSLIFIIYANQ